jgi:hypothetical protein
LGFDPEIEGGALPIALSITQGAVSSLQRRPAMKVGFPNGQRERRRIAVRRGVRGP